jgi:hypothetical protein
VPACIRYFTLASESVNLGSSGHVGRERDG